MAKQLTKSQDRKISGVAGGLADYFRVDPTLVRVIFVVTAILDFGFSIVVYIILAFVMP